MIELLTAFLILAVMAKMAVPVWGTMRAKTYRLRAETTMRDLRVALTAARDADSTSTSFYWGWTDRPGQVNSWDGTTFLPAMRNGSGTQVWAWLDQACEQGIWGTDCATDGAGVSVCKTGLQKSWMRWRDGSEVEWEWQGIPWC